MFKKINSYLLGALGVLTASCMTEKIPDISSFKENTNPNAVSYDENFNSGYSNWKFSIDSKASPGDGAMGSNGIFISKSDGQAIRSIKVIPGSVYKISIKYRSDGVETKEKSGLARFMLGFIRPEDRNGDKIKNQYFWAESKPSKNWQTFSSSITIPQNASENAELVLTLDWRLSGSIYFDDICLQPDSNAAVIIPLAPSNLALDKNGTIAVRASFFRDDNRTQADLAMLIEANDKQKLLYSENGVYSGSFGSFDGPATVSATLLDMKNKLILGKHIYHLYPQTEQEQKGAASIDKYGRTVCDGKPFLPIGIFTYQTMKKEDLERVRDAGFDFILFGPMVRNLDGKSSNTKVQMQNMLNSLRDYNLKAMLQLTLMIPGREHVRKKFEPEFDGLKKREDVLQAAVNAVEDNPNLLGYYLSDENQRDELPQVQELRETVNRIDTRHFTVTLTDRPDNFPFFASTGDVLCYDSYPLPDPNGLLKSEKGFDELSRLEMPIWFCSQAFLWRIIRKGHENEIDPSEAAVRALPLLAVIKGVKGFIFYSYHEIFVKGPKVDPEHAAKFWPQVVSAVKMLRELEPFIISTVKAPSISFELKSGKVSYRAMTDEEGRNAIMLVSLNSGENTLRIIPPPGKKYRSRYGLSTEQSDGSWIFATKEINCDILFSE